MSYEYEVALSFAGEDRVFAEAVAKGLRKAEVEVFYDNFYAEELWGEDLSVRLREIYNKSSQFCIMIISQHYVDKMWPSHERQQAIERMIKEKGKAYILPVRLDGFQGEVPGLSELIGYLAVRSNEYKKVVDAFLRKIERTVTPEDAELKKGPIKTHIPRLKKKFTDKEKNQFLKSSFEEIVKIIDELASETKKTYPHFDYEKEIITSRKAVFTLYENEKQVVQFKVFFGGILGSNSISFAYGSHLDIENNSSMNESISLEEHEGELILKPMGMGMFGAERDKLMSPQEVSEYLWKIVCKQFL
jgi:hypothetical protein